MGISEHEAGARLRPWLIAASAAIGWGTLTIVILHLISSHNPLLDSLSSYAFTDRGTGMLAASILSLAVGSLAVQGALHTAGIPLSRTTRILFGTWTLGLVVAALFPASYAEHFNPLRGEIHQYSCTIAFLSMPALGFSLLRSLPGNRTLERLTVAATGCLLLFGVSYAFPTLPLFGIIQRGALGIDVALLCSLLLAAKNSCVPARSNASILTAAEQPR
jgi:Protein of unknown function (DUF998)